MSTPWEGVGDCKIQAFRYDLYFLYLLLYRGLAWRSLLEIMFFVGRVG